MRARKAGRVVPKLLAPATQGIVRRPRVLTAIDRGLRSGICWIAAPAGYGKTTAVADYLRQKRLEHIWYRVDQGDQDVASFFHYLALSRTPARGAPRLPVFGPEYADQPREFARQFFRSYFARLRPGTLLVLDDLHDADVAPFQIVLRALLRELPETLSCACLSRALPDEELAELTLKGRLAVLDESILRFSDREARALVAKRVRRAGTAIEASVARGWAAALVLLADRASAASLRAHETRPADSLDSRAAIFATLAKPLFERLTVAEQEALLKLSLLPEFTAELARELTGSEASRGLLERLRRQQLLVTRGAGRAVFQFHDLLREYLLDRLTQQFPPDELARLRERAARLLDEAGHPDEAVDMALRASAWPLARGLIVARAEVLLAQGQRATLISWSAALPPGECDDAWLSYWLGVANMADDAIAESWLARAWSLFAASGDVHGQCLTAARAVLSKTDSWRTHEGLAVWTRRLLDLLGRDVRSPHGDQQLLVWSGMLRAVDFAEDYRTGTPAVERLVSRLRERLARPLAGDTASLRLLASDTLIDHAGSTGKADLFENAVDSVTNDLRAPDVPPWILGLWLVAFGAVSGRYFPYRKRGFPYASAEEALRAAVELGAREGLRGVEFGGLYHLQLLMKLRNDFTEFATLVARLAEIEDSRYTTQVAVVADCQAALHTRNGSHAEAYRACEKFMSAIEAANEPPIERWPHFITKFQVLLGDRKPAAAASFLESVLHLFDGGVRRRTLVCVLVARALEAKWGEASDYHERLSSCLGELRTSGWPSVIINLPGLLSELCQDALEAEIEPDFCRALIKRRALAPPESASERWPWPLRVYVLGPFRIERDGTPVSLGVKAPTRTLDIVRALAIAKDQSCALEELHEWLWPDADGDRAKAACEQALHRLRRLLGTPDLVVQREGRLRLSPERVWVDVIAWELDLRRTARRAPGAGLAAELERQFWSFSGPLFQATPATTWGLPAAERVRSRFIELTSRIGEHWASRGDHAKARTFYLRALDFYPASEGCYEALLRGRLAQGDHAGALEDYRRCQRVLDALGSTPSPAIRALMAPLLAAPRSIVEQRSRS
jgi:DNA-binding SARP family transcriptional activator